MESGLILFIASCLLLKTAKKVLSTFIFIALVSSILLTHEPTQEALFKNLPVPIVELIKSTQLEEASEFVMDLFANQQQLLTESLERTKTLTTGE